MPGLAVRLIAGRASNLQFSMVTSLLAPIELSDVDKYVLLQRLDRYRKWNSLNDKRYCLACGQVIDGREILVVGGTRGTGPLRLICPTRGCHSIPMDWVVPTGEVLARMSVLEAESAAQSRSSARLRGKIFGSTKKVGDAISAGRLS